MFKELSARLEAQFAKLARRRRRICRRSTSWWRRASWRRSRMKCRGAARGAPRRPRRHGRRARGPGSNTESVIVARRYVISGRVQGVGFRYFTEDLAQREGVSGFVRNLPDGRVEAVVEGDVESVGASKPRCGAGRAGARVDDIEIEETTPSGRLTGFRIAPDCCDRRPTVTYATKFSTGDSPKRIHRANAGRSDDEGVRRSATSRTFRSRASCSTTSRRCWGMPTGSAWRWMRWSGPIAARRRPRRRRREPRIHPGRGGRGSAAGRVRAGAQGGEAAVEDDSRQL